MKNNIIRGRTLAVIATIIMLIICFVSLGMYYVLDYYLYFFIFITGLCLGATNLLFILLKCEESRYKNLETSKMKEKIKSKKKFDGDTQETDEEIETGSKNKKGFSFHKVLLIILFILYIFVFYYLCTIIISFVRIVINNGTLSFSSIIPLEIIPLLIILVVVTVLDKLCENPGNKTKGKKTSEEFCPEKDEESELALEKQKQFRYHKLLMIIYSIAYVFVLGFCCTAIPPFAKTVVNEGIPYIANIIPLLLILIVATILEKFCEHSNNNTLFVDAVLQNCRAFYRLIIIETVLAIACVIIEYLQFFNIQKYIGYLYTGLFFYYFAFVAFSFLITIMRKEIFTSPYIVVPIPLVKNQIVGREQGFLDYLQENTGITLRNLWSMKYIRELAPTTVFMIGLLLWLSTCIVQVDNNQQAAVYRLGNLQEQVLEPGIHFTLPYPIDLVEIYETGKVNKVTIGYKSQENTDNIWTEQHQGEEYILLLGSGDEVVSINLRLEYKISDLKMYLRAAVSPESIMEALAYELITDQTIATDLASLMSTDRAAFSENFKQELSQKIQEKELGLEVVAVILESIHPPVNIASVYQELISAEIKAQQLLAKAEGTAAVTIAKAEAMYDITISKVKANYEDKLAAAKLDVAEFMASVEAYNTYSDAYTYYKYLAAVKEAYGDANLVIVGEGVDTSALYFGNLFSNEESNTEE